jgi:hypothetical protein
MGDSVVTGVLLSNRLAFGIAVFILLIGAFLRLYDLGSLPPGLNERELTDLRIAETVRVGRMEIFYNIGGMGREGSYPALLTALTTIAGGGAFVYRLPSVFAGLLALAATYALGKRLYGAPTGLVAMALMSVSMLPIVLSRVAIAESFAPLLCAVTLLLLAKAYPIYGRPSRQEPSVTTFAILGGLLGLGFYVTPAGFLMALITAFFIAYLVLTRQPLTRRMYSLTWFALVVMIVIATPYMIASFQNPSLSGAARVLDTSVTAPLRAFIGGLGGIFFVGDHRAVWNLPERPLLDLVSGLLILVGIYVAARGWRQPRFMLILIALVLLAPAALLTAESPNFLRFGALLPLLMVLVGLGVTNFYRNLHTVESKRVAMVALAGLVVFNIQWTMRDLFGAWSSHPDTQTAYQGQLGAIARYVDATAFNVPTVICDTALYPSQAAEQLTDSQVLILMLHRQDAPVRFVNCTYAMVFPNGGELSQVLFLKPDGMHNVNRFVGAWLNRGRPIHELPEGVGLWLDVAQPLANTIGAFTTTAPVAYAPETVGGMEVVGPPIRFGGNITFLGYVRDWTGSFRPGSVVTVPTYWRADGNVPADLSLFTHIQADPAAVPVAQTDTLNLLPQTLQARDVFLQVTLVYLPYTIPIGDYSLSIGAYQTNSDGRLPVYDGEDTRGTRLFIGEITVAS